MAIVSASGAVGKNYQPTEMGARTSTAQEAPVNTFDVIKATVNEATKGVGTFTEDIKAQQIKAYRGEETSGISGALVDWAGISNEGKKSLSEEDYKISPFFRQGLNYESGLTVGEARIKSERYDQQLKVGGILQRADNAQTVLGMTVGLAAGIGEPKNLVSGIVAGGLVRTPIFGLAETSSRFINLKNFMNAKIGLKLGEAAAVATRAGVEGAVAVGLTERSNKESADIVGDDYTMTDTLMNLVTSVAAGGLLEGGGVVFKNLRQSKEMRVARLKAQEASIANLKKRGIEFSENAINELESIKTGIKAEGKAAIVLKNIDNNTHAEASELATQQLVTGKIVNVEPVGIKKPSAEILTPEEFTDVVNAKHGTQAQLVQRENDIYLSAFKVAENERGKGVGKAAMSDIVKYADNARQSIEVTPTSAYGSDLSRLNKFYEGFGFKKEGDKMVRKPIISDKQINISEKVNAVNESLNNPKVSNSYNAEAIRTVDEYNAQYTKELDDDALQREIDEVGLDIDALRAAGFIDNEMETTLDMFQKGVEDADSYVDSIKKAVFCLTRG